MKNLLYALSISLFSVAYAHSQGLENVIVEKYYISNASDSVGSVGSLLPSGSTTYRVFVDMKPNCKFQMAYGSETHDMRIETTTWFFNNEDYGLTTPNGISVNNSKKNSVLIDSWVSVGGAAAGKYGVLKPKDTDGSIGNTSGILQNDNAEAGIPIKTNDGLMTGTLQSVTMLGLDDVIDVFNDGSANGNKFIVNAGCWSALSGAQGLDTTNIVLIGQFTTNGVFSFELNIQIQNPLEEIEKYVAKNPIGIEIQKEFLIYSSFTTDINNEDNTISETTINTYPNPISDFLSVEINVPKQCSKNICNIYSANGKLISHKELGIINNTRIEKIDMSSIPKGLYIVEITLDGVKSYKKIIK